ncbi:hypothetical protein CCMA1212_005474 [Trichoderma ghanense]|uniref:Uncharacterized protein n=1 Tax=Trichoderma ghanense TaxID=65468 RepID=A0ABY2H405_9HYPO
MAAIKRISLTKRKRTRPIRSEAAADVTSPSTDIAAQARHPTTRGNRSSCTPHRASIYQQPSWRPSRLGSGFAFPYSLTAARQILRGWRYLSVLLLVRTSEY